MKSANGTTPAEPSADDTGVPMVSVGAGNGMPHLLRTPRPDPETWPILRLSNLFDREPRGRSLSGIRSAFKDTAQAIGARTPVANVTERVIKGPSGDIALRIYKPTDGEQLRPAFVWFHGGAFLIGGLETANSICRRIARVSGAIVVSVKYRLAPEHNLYASREDGYAAVEWIARNGALIGIDTSRIAVGGNSAGGNISAAIAQECVRRGGPALQLQVLVYPATNLADEFPSLQENAHGYLLTAKAIEWIKSILGEVDAHDVRLSPAFNKNWHGLAPALIMTAGFDPVRDDGLAYAQLLRQQGIPVELLHYAGQFHGFLNFDALLRTSRDALRRIATSLAAAFADPSERHASQAPDRTIEIATAQTFPDTVLSDIVITSLQTGEWIERKRNRLLAAVWPWSLSASLPSMRPLLSPVTATRYFLANQYAELEVRETYKKPA